MPVLFANPRRQVFSRQGPYVLNKINCFCTYLFALLKRQHVYYSSRLLVFYFLLALVPCSFVTIFLFLYMCKVDIFVLLSEQIMAYAVAI